MRPEEYRKIIKNLETHFAEFKVSCSGSQMFADEDKRAIESEFNGATAHYDQLVVQLPVYSQYQCFSSLFPYLTSKSYHLLSHKGKILEGEISHSVLFNNGCKPELKKHL